MISVRVIVTMIHTAPLVYIVTREVGQLQFLGVWVWDILMQIIVQEFCLQEAFRTSVV